MRKIMLALAVLAGAVPFVTAAYAQTGPCPSSDWRRCYGGPQPIGPCPSTDWRRCY